ncbi:signal recognition particle subunit SRP19/SEC65 family protein [Methanosphaera sp. ISO3-F5]|uniref:signal recognition particle subunit SRP19/SEC65 family protein n=1 Tax=Methanosphaera sp. ISO3-F5 TaxID=1452353 RepID=UPI002B2575E5|nr:signal recognition particle subunit SRP19/SEC65 family protein [Methanosphaera sp. ISO3-F5]WQH64528.1 signal recognition particle subunit SRP19/SEC65 family protein [Methanosphaera sp. ISO3-F5]
MKTMVWPVYINSQHTRKEGRMISLDEAVEEPKIREISQALRKLKIQYTVEHDKSFPGSWWEKSGRVIVEHDFPTKVELLRKIASTIKINRHTE